MTRKGATGNAGGTGQVTVVTSGPNRGETGRGKGGKGPEEGTERQAEKQECTTLPSPPAVLTVGTRGSKTAGKELHAHDGRELLEHWLFRQAGRRGGRGGRD